MMNEQGRQNGRTADNARSEQNVQQPNRIDELLTEPKTKHEQQQRKWICTLLQHVNENKRMGEWDRTEGRKDRNGRGRKRKIRKEAL